MKSEKHTDIAHTKEKTYLRVADADRPSWVSSPDKKLSLGECYVQSNFLEVGRELVLQKSGQKITLKVERIIQNLDDNSSDIITDQGTITIKLGYTRYGIEL